jgi:hypothetical protein
MFITRSGSGDMAASSRSSICLPKGSLPSAGAIRAVARKNAAQWVVFERTKAFRPFLRVVAIVDPATNPTYLERHNLVLHIDDPFWNYWVPAIVTKCSLQTLSQRDVDRLLREGEQLRFVAPTGW